MFSILSLSSSLLLSLPVSSSSYYYYSTQHQHCLILLFIFCSFIFLFEVIDRMNPFCGINCKWKQTPVITYSCGYCFNLVVVSVPTSCILYIYVVVGGVVLSICVLSCMYTKLMYAKYVVVVTILLFLLFLPLLNDANIGVSIVVVAAKSLPSLSSSLPSSYSSFELYDQSFRSYNKKDQDIPILIALMLDPFSKY